MVCSVNNLVEDIFFHLNVTLTRSVLLFVIMRLTITLCSVHQTLCLAPSVETTTRRAWRVRGFLFVVRSRFMEACGQVDPKRLQLCVDTPTRLVTVAEGFSPRVVLTTSTPFGFPST